MNLVNLTTNFVISNKLIEAKTFISRAKGLIGVSKFDFVLWIKRCNSIHTFFMKIPIDVVFVNKHLVVKKIYKNLKPWKFVFPILKASSVFEMTPGLANRISVGDRLNVGD